jgi:predicted ATPase
MARGLQLRSFRLKNFKSVLDSGVVKFTPLTAFIGNNGAGKSSLIEGLETLQLIAALGLDKAMQRWRGIEHIWHKDALSRATIKFNKEFQTFHLNNMISFDIASIMDEKSGRLHIEVGAENPSLDRIFATGFVRVDKEKILFGMVRPFTEITSIGIEEIHNWQFLELSPTFMGLPRPRQRAYSEVRLEKDGSNVAEYLLSIRELDARAFEGIIETLMYVLPYAKDVQPSITSELERTVYLQLTEKDFKVPGWLLSSGTLRVLALLCVLRHPNPAPLIVIEELENGLDPRTVQLILDEIRHVTTSGKSQVIFTTHSPYLLDLLRFNEIVLVERIDGAPQFFRPDPSNNETLQRWTEKFNPGQLYTMGQLRAGEKK